MVRCFSSFAVGQKLLRSTLVASRFRLYDFGDEAPMVGNNNGSRVKNQAANDC